jgi:hypothetical protein
MPSKTGGKTGTIARWAPSRKRRVRPRNPSKYMPHHGDQERERRFRQISNGSLRVENGLMAF